MKSPKFLFIGLRRRIREVAPLNKRYNHVFIVGAQKAGTTSLHAYLTQHPQVTGGDTKELHFFNREHHYSKGENFYRSLFPVCSSATYALDSTPVYLHNISAAERIHHYAPDAKIVVILREPVSRAFSAFNMYRQMFKRNHFQKFLRYANDDVKAFFLPLAEGKVKPDINYFLDRERAIINGGSGEAEPALIRRGLYAPQLERYTRLFGDKNIRVIFSDDLRRDPEKTVNHALQFMGLSPLSDADYPLKHVREYTVDSQVRDEIERCAGSMFLKDKQELIDIFGLKAPW